MKRTPVSSEITSQSILYFSLKTPEEEREKNIFEEINNGSKSFKFKSYSPRDPSNLTRNMKKTNQHTSKPNC